MEKHLIAAIDVGSHAMRMKIGEIAKDGSFRELETFRKVISIGHDTFTTGRLCFDTVERVCDILDIFKKTMNDYDIRIYQAMATSAIREASNRDYIIDQIKLKTDIDLRVISNSQEQYLTHKAIKYRLEDYDKYINEGAVIVVIGAGTIQVTTYKGGQLTSSQNIKLGALRVKETLSKIESSSLKYQDILAEFIQANLSSLDFFSKDIEYKHFIAVGGEVSSIQRMVSMEYEDSEMNTIHKGRFKKLYDKISDFSVNEIVKSYNISRGRASIIIPSMMMFGLFLEKAKTKKIIVPDTSLVDGIVKDLYEAMYNVHNQDELSKDIVTSGQLIAKKFGVDMAHASCVEDSAVKLFEGTREIHGLDDRARLLLRMASILHDVGKYVGLSDHNTHSFYLTKSSELFGLSEDEMVKIALVTKYHGGGLPSQYDEGFGQLSDIGRVYVSKLIAIIRIADALDRSHKQKINVNSIKVKSNKLTIKCTSHTNTKLEEWSFAEKSTFFEEVFGIKPVLRIKKEL